MDTPPESAFERVTKMVAELYGVSIALVSLVAEEREWFKSAHGPDALDTPRDIVLSSNVVPPGRPVMVTDMSVDSPFPGHQRAPGATPLPSFAGGASIRTRHG